MYFSNFSLSFSFYFLVTYSYKGYNGWWIDGGGWWWMVNVMVSFVFVVLNAYVYIKFFALPRYWRYCCLPFYRRLIYIYTKWLMKFFYSMVCSQSTWKQCIVIVGSMALSSEFQIGTVFFLTFCFGSPFIVIIRSECMESLNLVMYSGWFVSVVMRAA